MKMRKFYAVLLSMVMIFAAFVTGCSKDDKEGNTGTENNGTSVVQTITIKADGFRGIDMDVTLTLKSTDKASSVSVNGSAKDESGTNFDLNFDEVVKLAGNRIYFNVGDVLSVIPLLTDEIEGIDVSELSKLIDAEWVYFEAEGMSASSIDVSVSDDSVKNLKEAFAALGTVEGDTTTYKFDSAESYKAAVEALVKLINDNAEAWADSYAEAMKDVDYAKIAESLVDKIAEAMSEAYGGAIFKDVFKEQLMETVDVDEIEFSKEDILASYKEAADSLNEALELIDGEEVPSTVVKVTDKSNGFTVSVVMEMPEGAEEGTFEVVADVTTGAEVSVKEPSDAKDVMDLVSELISSLMAQMSDIEF